MCVCVYIYIYIYILACRRLAVAFLYNTKQATVTGQQETHRPFVVTPTEPV